MPFFCVDLQLGLSQLSFTTAPASGHFRRRHELMNPVCSSPGSNCVAFVEKLMTGWVLGCRGLPSDSTGAGRRGDAFVQNLHSEDPCLPNKIVLLQKLCLSRGG
uniref:Uncharacterized protein n=1 Tax=Mus musculus TaxID=10090 RepID=Q3TRY6_MOUSE|nr:unnamed protein product [Mus musculus]